MFRKWSIIVSLIGYICAFAACSPVGLHEAQITVSKADSIWQAGGNYTDSVRMGEAYETLGHWQWFYPDEYVHVCYHYGRLLRANDNSVEAMQAFISATHSRTRDYHILGRIYSNMGDLCHLANEYALSYDMYKRSAEMYLHNGDSLMYFYDLNNMAYEKAMLVNKEACLGCLHDIEQNCTDREIIFKTMETKAELYLKCKQYDSVLYYASSFCKQITNSSSGLLLKAQAYSYLEIQDSAIHYAELVLDNSPTLEETNNALYILTNDDEFKDKESIRQTAAERSNTQKLIELRQMKISQAVQLLEQDIAHKPDLQWLYAVIVIVFTIGSCLFLYIHRRRNQHKLLSQQVDDMSKINDAVKKQHEQIQKEYTEYKDNLLNRIEQNCAVFTQSPNMFQDINWKDYNAMSQVINTNFGMLIAKLQGIYFLSEKEIRLCILVLLEVSNSKQMAKMLYYGESGIRNFKNRTAKKIGTNSIEMRNSLLKIAISEYSNTANNEIIHAKKC